MPASQTPPAELVLEFGGAPRIAPAARRRRSPSGRAARQAVRVVRVVAAVALGVSVWRACDILWGMNLTSIVSGEAYRSGQLTGPQLVGLIDQIGLRTVVNLRGDNPTAWHRAEAAVCDAAGVRHYDVPMSARQLPEPETVLELLAILREAPRPLLVHCKSGADRAGLAAALYLIQDEGLSVDESLAAGLCAWRGHLPVSATDELDRFLGLFRRHGSGKSLKQWTREDYPRIFLHEWRPAHPLL